MLLMLLAISCYCHLAQFMLVADFHCCLYAGDYTIRLTCVDVCLEIITQTMCININCIELINVDGCVAIAYCNSALQRTLLDIN